MKKIPFLLTISLLIFMQSLAQKAKHTANITFAAGPAFPTGNFANKDVLSSVAGIAKTGEYLSFSYNHLLGKRFGFTVSIQGQRNPIDTKAFENAFSTSTKIRMGDIWFGSFTPPGQLPAQSLNPAFPNWKFEKSCWLSASLLAGGYGEFPVKSAEGLAFTAKAMAGIVYAASPKLSGKSISDTAMASAEQISRLGLGIVAELSGGIKYDLNKKLSLLVNIDYLVTNKIRFKNIKSTMNGIIGRTGSVPQQVWQSMVTEDGQQEISSLNIGVGIAWRL